MQELLNYLSVDHNFHSAVLWLGDFGQVKEVKQLCEQYALDRLIVVAGNVAQAEQQLAEETKNQPELYPEEIRIVEGIDSLENLQETVLILPTMPPLETLVGLAARKPRALYGIVPNGMPAFEVWELFRGSCSRICLIGKRECRPDEHLVWNRDTDVELSIIFPMYKVSAQLRQCIDSVTAWKAPYVEYLFVDDGSPDDCADIVQEYAARDPRIHLLQKKNGGCASARQYGLERANGRYIGFVDPDDFVEQDMFRKLLARAMSGSYQIAWCGYQEYYDSTGETKKIDDPMTWPYTDGTTEEGRIASLISGSRIAIWRCIFQHRMLKQHQIGFHTDLPRFDDLPFKFEAFAVAKSVVCVPEHLYYYRLSRPGQDVAADDERLYVHFDIFRHLDAFLEKHSTRLLLDQLQIVKVNTHQWALQKMQPRFVKEYTALAQKDLLHNAGVFLTRLSFRRKLNRTSLAYFYAISFNRYKRVLSLNKKNKL